ncbi:MAG: hypothetical protein F6J93_25550 [Oscillatoria sp. SIO1A7]|nr:hypothetical protein [Oscillatoria sp. SIO1A7]
MGCLAQTNSHQFENRYIGRSRFPHPTPPKPHPSPYTLINYSQLPTKT